ncbi:MULTISPECIES: efflux RND transporter permease subunit [Pontibacillus]|uniref:Efflux RND transporter permease subunit n=1 Tax=Pontibacillus chungwhensis TaxID=265426 RepID=A0ABY8UTH4_9BACI|nr:MULTISPECIES: efflux RND transporter permease subunit [Pontibacillus]MCD5322947.1 efflux RND transporter permease subunit [Pontibacillus sp. HN14]WIF96342.1 efflux RND transporter permease subunit [Pontibacillus chungwhensis]
MNWILKYRKIVWIFILLLVFTGIFTYVQLPKREIPEINVNIATISTVYPGATPKEVESTITNPFEDGVEDIAGIDSVESVSSTGFSSVTLTLTGDANRQTVFSKIRQTVSDVSRTFPDNVQDPSVQTDFRMSAVASYHLTAEDFNELYDIRGSVQSWKESLEGIAGVDQVQVKGLPEQQLLVELDSEALNDQGLSPFQITQTLSQELSPGAIGTTEENGEQYQLLLNKTEDWKELESLSVGKKRNGDPLFLSDVGSISLNLKETEDLITYKEKPSLSLTILANEGQNISALQDKITKEVNLLSDDLPSNIDVDRFYTQSTIIEEVFTSLVTSFAISVVAVLIIMLFGLPVSSAILVSISIPISVIIGLIPLPYVGVDLNQISIIGIIIAIGILVDDAIVVNDNIQRRFQLGDSAWQGTIQGVKEVRVSIITSTLMIIFSFFPLTFISGSNGDFIRALPTTLITTIIASTIMALTLIPTVQYIRRKRKDQEKPPKKVGLLGSLFNGIEDTYANRILPRVTKRPFIIGFSGLLVCVLLALLVTRIPFEFFPEADRQEVTISVTYPQETTLDNTQEQLNDMEQFIQEKSNKIDETAVFAGSGMPNLFSSGLQQSGEYTGQILVRVDKSQTSASSFINEWEQPLREEYPDAEIFLETIVSGPPPSPPVEVKIQGEEIEELLSLSNELKGKINDLDGAELVTLNMNDQQPYIEYNLDREKMADLNLSVDQISSQIQAASAGIPLTTFDNGVEKYFMKVLLDDGDEAGVNLSNLQIAAPSANQNGAPEIVSLDELISEEKTEQIGSIPHLDGERTLTLKAYGEEGSNDFQKDANQIVSDFEETLPNGYSFTTSGQANAQQEFFIEVSKLFVIILFLIYLVIAIQFNSLLMPLLITSTVFLAITGAIIGLFISNQPLSFLAVLGIVSLSGIVVRNSVILIEFIEQNYRASESIITAVIEAGRARIRPIILTTLTSIAALVPIIVSGDVLFRPLAVSIVAGLAFSTILTLLLLPAFYLILYRIRNGKKSLS